jgi:hypothetical protein
LRIDNGKPRKFLAVERQDIEGVELHFVVMLARMQRVEIRDTVDTEHHRLAVDHELLVSILKRRLKTAAHAGEDRQSGVKMKMARVLSLATFINLRRRSRSPLGRRDRIEIQQPEKLVRGPRHTREAV